jgi:hypothetical protein
MYVFSHIAIAQLVEELPKYWPYGGDGVRSIWNKEEEIDVV